MSGDGDTRSMDDVLSAIRKIMKPEDEAETPAVAEGEDDPLPLTSEMRVVEGGTEAAEEAGASVAEIVSEAQEAIGEAAASDGETAAKDEVPDVSEEETAAAVEADETGTAGLDESAIEAIVRRVIREELVEGDIGRNISENVKRLIQHEVAQALKDG